MAIFKISEDNLIMLKKLLYTFTLTTLLLTGCGESDKTNEVQTSSENLPNDSTNKPTGDHSGYVSPLPDTAPTYTVAMMEFLPYRFKDEYGNEIGYEVDLLHAISEEAGFKADIKNEPFNNILPSIQKGDNDFAMFALTLTPERQKIMLASQPYSIVKPGYLVTANSTYKDIDSLSGKKIATLSGSSLQKSLENKGVTKIIGKQTLFLSFQAIFTGEAEATFSEEPALIYASQQFPETPSRFIPTGTMTETVIYAGKDKQELSNKINMGLDGIIKNGKYQEIHKKWFHEHADDIMIDKAKNL